ncbi:MAG: hypothetical protein FWH22_10635, partial [Fibromonadales bacterium]|nr:hypothetical protein [Fibromonadales bacterium]
MKKGFGIIEVVAAAVVLAFLLVGLNIMQKGNREAVLRIRARDAAQIVAQDFLDSLNRLGVSSVNTGGLPIEKIYEWEGRGEIVSRITYTINATIDYETALNSTERSEFTKITNADTTH